MSTEPAEPDQPVERPGAAEWVAAFAARLGVAPPDEEQTRLLLDLAGVAAHSSERPAAPIACWLAGMSRTPAAEALEAARSLQEGRSGPPAR